MPATFEPSEKFKFDKLTREILHDLVERAQGDTLTWDAVIFRRDYGKHLSLVDQLVNNGFIVHDRERNTYRLHLPFFRMLEGVYISNLLADINSLMSACRNHYRTWFDDPVTIRRLSEQSELDFERVKTLSRYLQWAGLLAIPRGALDGDSRLLVNEYILEPSSIEEWMDKQLQAFDITKNNLGIDTPSPGAYSTPLLRIVSEAIHEFYAGRERAAHPDKAKLVEWLNNKTVDGKKISKNLVESIYQLLKAPDRRRAIPRRRSSDKLSESDVNKGAKRAKAGSKKKSARTMKDAVSADAVAVEATFDKDNAAFGDFSSVESAVAKKVTAKKRASNRATSKKKTVSKKTSAKKITTKKATVKKTASKKASSKKATAKKAVAKKTSSRKTANKPKTAPSPTSNDGIPSASSSSD